MAGEAKEADRTFVLSASFLGDGNPLRSTCALNDDGASEEKKASEGGSVKLMSGSDSGVLTEHEVSGMSNILPSEESRHPVGVSALLGPPQGGTLSYYVTGCRDGAIRVFNATSHVLEATLRGHEKAVTSLSWVYFSDNELVLLASGSWDGSARLWNLKVAGGAEVAGMSGHENTVTVQGLPPSSSFEGSFNSIHGRFASGSAGVASSSSIVDHKVRLWDVTVTGEQVAVAINQTLESKHEGPIRGLCADANLLVTCSNDGSLKVRIADSGEVTLTLFASSSASASPPILLDVACIRPGFYVAAGEDGSAYLWDTKAANLAPGPTQVIAHPDCVWSVLGLSNGDFVTACNDGHLRIFTTEASRKASAEDIAQFDDAVMEATAKRSKGPSSEEISKLPKWEDAPLHTGKSEGFVQLFQRDGKAIAAQWSTASSTWIEVGEVTGSPDGGGSTNAGMIDGVRYDHVLPIELENSGEVRNLQIGYNDGENPFIAAQSFIDKYMLDQNYLAQIADYIRQRVGASVPTIGMDGSSSSGATFPGALVGQPSSSSVGPPVPSSPYKHLPMKGYKFFEGVGDLKKSLTKMVGKIKEFNSAETEKLSEAELDSHLTSLIDTLSQTSRYHATVVGSHQLAVVSKMLSKWKTDHVFPALDLARLIVLHPDSVKAKHQPFWTTVLDASLRHATVVRERHGTSIADTAVPMLCLRLCCNCFRAGNVPLQVMLSRMDSLLECAESFATAPDNKNIRLSVSTFLLNVASYVHSKKGEGECASWLEPVVKTVGAAIGTALYEEEAVVRALVALGTSLLATDDDGRAKAVSNNVMSMVDVAVGQQSGSTVTKAVAADIRKVLEQ